MPTFVQTIRHLRRYQQIGRVLTRYGFGQVLTQLGIARAIAPGLEKLRFSSAEILRATPAERVRMVLEELGPTFIKLGQILSTRADILPTELVKELEKLQDTVPASNPALIQAQIERELGKPLFELYANFDPVPVASASLGQVHLATLPGGEEVAVKVLRPGVDRVIEVDLDILLELAALAERRTEWGRYYNVWSLARELADMLHQEQNYEQEGHNMDRYRHIFADDPSVYIPTVYWAMTTRRVLTMERVQGIKITDIAALEAAHLDRKIVARRNITILLKAILHHGFFHADPHAGNFMVLPGEVLALMDFGIMGHLDQSERLGLVRLFVALLRQDPDRAAEALLDLGIATQTTDKRKLSHDLDRLRLRYYGLDLEKIRARSFFEELMAVAFAHRLKMPSNLVLVFKTIAMLEGISLQLDPNMNLFEELEPYVREAISELESPLARLKDTIERMEEAAEALMLLPGQLQIILRQLENGEVELGMALKGWEEPTRRMSSAANRLALAILAAAFVIGPALIIPYVQQFWPDWRGAILLLIVGGFLLSLVITAVLFLSIWRSGR